MRTNAIATDKRIFGLEVLYVITLLLLLIANGLSFVQFDAVLVNELTVLCSFLGVETLLVLSGFLFGLELYKRLVIAEVLPIKGIDYFLKTWFLKFYPIYFIVVLVSILFLETGAFSYSALGSYFFLIQNFKQPISSFFGASWVIAVFAQSCLFILFLMYLIFKLKLIASKSKLFLLSCLLLICLCLLLKTNYSFSTVHPNLMQWNSHIKSVAIYRFDSVCIGILCSWIYFNFKMNLATLKYICLLLGVILLLLMYVGVGFFRIHIEAFPFFWNVCYLPLTSITIVLFFPWIMQWKPKLVLPCFTAIDWFQLVFIAYLTQFGIVNRLVACYFDVSSWNKLEFATFLFFSILFTGLISWLIFHCLRKLLTRGSAKN